MTQEERFDFLIRYLLNESEEYGEITVPADQADRRRLLRALMNVRPPHPVSGEFLRVQDEYLQKRLAERGVTHIKNLTPVEPGLYLRKGDITTLAADAVVNAANSRLLGCFAPCHGCIDNAIHTYAGVQLRLECARIMAAQKNGRACGPRENHGRLQPSLPSCAAHGRPGCVRKRYAAKPRGACRLLPFLPGTRRGGRAGQRGVLLYLYRGISLSQSGGGGNSGGNRPRMAAGTPRRGAGYFQCF